MRSERPWEKKKTRARHARLRVLGRSLGGWQTVARPAPPTTATFRAVSPTWWWRMGGQWRGVAVGARRAASPAIELSTLHARRPPFYPHPCGVATDQHGRPGLPGHTFHHKRLSLPGAWTGGWDAPGAGGLPAGKQKKTGSLFFSSPRGRARTNIGERKKKQPAARAAGAGGRPPARLSLPLTPPPLGSPQRPSGSGRSPASCPG